MQTNMPGTFHRNNNSVQIISEYPAGHRSAVARNPNRLSVKAHPKEQRGVRCILKFPHSSSSELWSRRTRPWMRTWMADRARSPRGSHNLSTAVWLLPEQIYSLYSLSLVTTPGWHRDKFDSSLVFIKYHTGHTVPHHRTQKYLSGKMFWFYNIFKYFQFIP